MASITLLVAKGLKCNINDNGVKKPLKSTTSFPPKLGYSVGIFMRFNYWLIRAFLFVLPLLVGMNARAQANLPIYTSYLVNGFQNWSWAAVNFSASYSGSNCISVTDTTGSSGLY